MRRLVFVSTVCAVLALLLAPGFASPRAVQACSAGPDWDAVAEADAIITGRVVDMRLAPEYGGGAPVPETVAVWLDIEVDRYLKGTGPRDLSVLDGASVVFLDGQTDAQKAEFEGALFWGSGGACGALNEDPRGQYWVTGLFLHDGVYHTHLLLLIGAGAIGSGSEDPSVVERIEEVEARVAALGPLPAAAGHGAPGLSRSPGTSMLPLLALGVALVFVVSARTATRRHGHPHLRSS